jgi:hypothetical protein
LELCRFDDERRPAFPSNVWTWRKEPNVSVILSPDAGATSELRFQELAANGPDYVGLKAPSAIAASQIWTLPSADGTSGQVLSTNGAGLLSWASPGTGAWTALPYNASDYTASGSMTWTVDSTDINIRYLVFGKTMILALRLAQTTVGGTVSNELRVAIPGGKTVKSGANIWSPFIVVDNTHSTGAMQNGLAVAASGSSYISLFKFGYTDWTLSTNNTDLAGQIIFEIT